MIKPSIYFHPEVFATSKPVDQIKFAQNSYHHYNSVRESILSHLSDYPTLPLRKACILDYLKVHSADYINSLDQPNETESTLSVECMGLEHCIPGYLYSLGGMFEAIDQMLKGLIERAYCFSMVGHHSYKNWGHGYCLLNPQAAAVKYAQSQGFKKILIIDWDIHHGDGTQSIFSNDPNTYCISIHSAMDLYMAKVSNLKAGTTTYGNTVGHCNIPLLPSNYPKHILDLEGMTGDFYTPSESIPTFEQSLNNLPRQPDLITIFSGYDSHKNDCGKGITDWSNFSFCQLTKLVTTLATNIQSPILSIHGGGYNLPVTTNAALAHIQSL